MIPSSVMCWMRPRCPVKGVDGAENTSLLDTASAEAPITPVQANDTKLCSTSFGWQDALPAQEEAPQGTSQWLGPHPGAHWDSPLDDFIEDWQAMTFVPVGGTALLEQLVHQSTSSSNCSSCSPCEPGSRAPAAADQPGKLFNSRWVPMELPEGWDASSQADSDAQHVVCKAGGQRPCQQSASKQGTENSLPKQQQQPEHGQVGTEGGAETEDSLAVLHLVNPYQRQQKQGIPNNQFVGQF